MTFHPNSRWGDVLQTCRQANLFVVSLPKIKRAGCFWKATRCQGEHLLFLYPAQDTVRFVIVALGVRWWPQFHFITCHAPIWPLHAEPSPRLIPGNKIFICCPFVAAQSFPDNLGVNNHSALESGRVFLPRIYLSFPHKLFSILHRLTAIPLRLRMRDLGAPCMLMSVAAPPQGESGAKEWPPLCARSPSGCFFTPLCDLWTEILRHAFPGCSWACRAQSLLLSERLSSSLLGRTSDNSDESPPPTHTSLLRRQHGVEVSMPAAIRGVEDVYESVCLCMPSMKAHQIARGAPWKLKADDWKGGMKKKTWIVSVALDGTGHLYRCWILNRVVLRKPSRSHQVGV